MKHTIIAGMLLILILLVVVMNATFVRSVTDELYTRLNELPVSKGGFEASGGDDVKSFYALISKPTARHVNGSWRFSPHLPTGKNRRSGGFSETTDLIIYNNCKKRRKAVSAGHSPTAKMRFIAKKKSV